jgi:hypothetical protein
MSIALVLLPDFFLIVAGVLLARLRAFDAVFGPAPSGWSTSCCFPHCCSARSRAAR